MAAGSDNLEQDPHSLRVRVEQLEGRVATIEKQLEVSRDATATVQSGAQAEPEAGSSAVGYFRDRAGGLDSEVEERLRRLEELARVRDPQEQLRTTKSNQVFVAISFEEHMKYTFQAIKDAAAGHGLEARRTTEDKQDRTIIDSIMKMTQEAQIVVADLTGLSPNVFFELGYARGLGKKVITIAKKDTDIPFDVGSWNYVDYSDSRHLEEKLNEELAKSLADMEGKGYY